MRRAGCASASPQELTDIKLDRPQEWAPSSAAAADVPPRAGFAGGPPPRSWIHPCF